MGSVTEYPLLPLPDNIAAQIPTYAHLLKAMRFNEFDKRGDWKPFPPGISLLLLFSG
jgi:hypothetical protein